MSVKRINSTVYFVKNWDQAVTFYRDTLGLKPLVIVPRIWAQFEAPGGGRIALQLQPPDGDDPPHVSIDVGDIRDFVGWLQANGVKVIEPVTAGTLISAGRLRPRPFLWTLPPHALFGT
jgi:catechol 2,3-dioxygenase-like lactoylglutathione lyase family enzyme